MLEVVKGDIILDTGVLSQHMFVLGLPTVTAHERQKCTDDVLQTAR